MKSCQIICNLNISFSGIFTLHNSEQHEKQYIVGLILNSASAMICEAGYIDKDNEMAWIYSF